MLLPFDPLIRFHLFGMRLTARISGVIALGLVIGGILSRLEGGRALSNGQFLWAVETAFCCAVVIVVLVVHEAAQHHVARRLGVTVRRVDLYLFGGSQEIIEDSATPRTEAITGAAGVLVLALFAAAFVLIEIISRTAAAPAHLVAKTLALSLTILALLQVAPALPLDGGRIFRALVWYLADDGLTGVKGAAFVARLHGAALVATGIVLLGAEGTMPFWGAGALVAGLQLGGAARGAVHGSSWQRLSRSVTLRAALSTTPAAISADLVIDDAVDLLLTAGTNVALLVTGPDGEPAGMLHIANLHRARRAEWGERTVAEIMTPLTELPRLDADMSVFDAVARMDDAHQTLSLIEEDEEHFRAVTREQLIHRLFDRERAIGDRR